MHPFYSPVKGWTSAVDLRAGDILVMLNGEYVVVEQVQHELLESPETTYNFEVEDFHTYYVGDISVLVHNACKAAKKAGLPTKGKVRGPLIDSAAHLRHIFSRLLLAEKLDVHPVHLEFFAIADEKICTESVPPHSISVSLTTKASKTLKSPIS